MKNYKINKIVLDSLAIMKFMGLELMNGILIN